MGSTTSVRISGEAHEVARALADETGQSVRQIVECSVLAYHGHWIIEQTNRMAERIQREDDEGWRSYQAEMELFQHANMDGLRDEPPYPVPEEHRRRDPELYADQG